MSHYDPYEKLRRLEIAYRRGEVPERVYRVLKAKYLREIREIERYERSLLGEEWEREEEPLFEERKVRVSLDIEGMINELTKHLLSLLPFVIGGLLATLSVLSPIFAILPILIGIYMIRKERSHQKTLGKILIVITVVAVFFHMMIFAPAYSQLVKLSTLTSSLEFSPITQSTGTSPQTLPEASLVLLDYSMKFEKVWLDKVYLDSLKLNLRNEGSSEVYLSDIKLSCGEYGEITGIIYEEIGPEEEDTIEVSFFLESLKRELGSQEIPCTLEIRDSDYNTVLEEEVSVEIPTVWIGDVVDEIEGLHNMSLTLVKYIESDKAVDGPYSSGYYTFTAKPGMKFVILVYKFQNNWNRPQSTPYFDKCEVMTDKGYIYPCWSPPAGIHSEEYNPRKSTQEEIETYVGTSGGFEELLPEESTIGCIVFEMPEDETPVEIAIEGVPYIIELNHTLNPPSPLITTTLSHVVTQTTTYATIITTTGTIAAGAWDCGSIWLGNRTGRVTAIIDGDTVEVEGCRIRLALIDAPEIDELNGELAKEFLESLIPVGTLVKVDQDNGQPFDIYGRIVAVIYRGSINVNAALLEDGVAKLFKRYCVVSEFSDDAWAVEFGCDTTSTLTPVSTTTATQIKRDYTGCIVVVQFHYDAVGNDNYNLNDEYVTLENVCDSPIDMSGWQLTDEGAKHVYRFKKFVLRPKATVTIHSGTGVDTSTDLYWGRNYGAVWNNDGDTLHLYDANGQLVLVERY